MATRRRNTGSRNVSALVIRFPIHGDRPDPMNRQSAFDIGPAVAASVFRLLVDATLGRMTTQSGSHECRYVCSASRSVNLIRSGFQTCCV